MQLTKTQKKEIIEMFKMVDAKKLEIEAVNVYATKWFRFGSYNGMQIATEIIKSIQEVEDEKTARIVD